MALRFFLFKNDLLVFRGRNLRFIAGLRCFSNERRKEDIVGESKPGNVAEELKSPTSWLNIRAGIFGPQDLRLPLPGDIGLASKRSNKFGGAHFGSITIHKPFSLLNQSEQIEVLSKLDLDLDFSDDEDMADTERNTNFECRVQTCPTLLKKDFQMLFPQQKLIDKDLSVITVCQKTKNDMSGWSESVEEEREAVMHQFFEAASGICDTLKLEGYWADFIDPCSGRPFLGPYSTDTFFETDERYRQLGFRIEDLGCCKVISHKNWGTNIFVGAIFTNAAVESEVIDDALCDYNIVKNLKKS